MLRHTYLVSLCLFVGVIVFAAIGINSRYASHSIDLERSNSPSHLLLVVLDSRPGQTNGVPDSLTLIDLRSGEVQGIPRDFTDSKLEGETVVSRQLGIKNCEPICSIQGVYMFSQLQSELDGDESKVQALKALQATVAFEFGIPSPALVVTDLTWSYSFFHKLAPIQLDVKEPIPVGGYDLNGYRGVERYLPSGLSSLTGEDMFWYARARFGSSNEDRMQRQLKLIKSISAQKSVVDIVFGAWHAKGYLKTDLKQSELISLITSIPKFQAVD